MQTKKDSLKEVIFNTAVGMLGSFAINLICLNLFTTAIAIAISTTILCTIFSISRGYTIRRFFNARWKEQQGR